MCITLVVTKVLDCICYNLDLCCSSSIGLQLSIKSHDNPRCRISLVFAAYICWITVPHVREHRVD